MNKKWLAFQNEFNQNKKILDALKDGLQIIILFFILLFRRTMLEDENFGSLLHKLSKQFFCKNFAFTYIKKSRINESYKDEHYLKIKKFQ